MKTVKYNDCIKVVCPVCKKTILQDPDIETGKGNVEMSPCKHTMLWYNDACGELVHVNKSLKKDVKELEKLEQTDEYYGDMLFHKVAKNRKLKIYKYDGGCLGGCQEAIDLIAFAV